MKKKLLTLFAVGVLATSAVFTGCGSKEKAESSTEASSDDKVIKIGASASPHAEILEQIKDNLEEQGYTLEIVVYDDYIIPNTALEDGELDANFFQHAPYLNDFNEQNGTHIVGVAPVHFEPMAIYAGKSSSLDDIKEGASIAIPNDTTNEARALLLLEANGLITLNEDAGVTATVLDIEENPYNLEIEELEAAQIPRSIEDVDFAVINGNYALSAGVTGALAYEASDSLAAETYANIVCVKEGNEETEKTKALVNAILSDEVRDYINDQYQGAVVPVF
ncbi:MetQ/NlpA family ABC transporter substrate-binding protein [Pseudobutyrivibrio sp.]|uniref:MetQ/NlpA family ABC transporter substrate-binding protein n=1 Tax=Pseudobutyrivibrio sp. TaxID=2014367 RepID=UPI001DAA31AF|nr:MetQ/NlpA family ABC transporter substrate-binding protein [Pseudobutyrivibrio sp.]MBE5910761.1 ABC transporter substrate-binding protein [Pseudobutyrivibrio sp.]